MGQTWPAYIQTRPGPAKAFTLIFLKQHHPSQDGTTGGKDDFVYQYSCVLERDSTVELLMFWWIEDKIEDCLATQRSNKLTQ